jgi:hypothetical protein
LQQFHFFFNGFHIISEICFPELLEAGANEYSADTEIYIRLGAVPNSLKNISVSNRFYQISDNDFLLNIKNVGKFYVQGNDTVVVELFPGTSEEQLRRCIDWRTFWCR